MAPETEKVSQNTLVLHLILKILRSVPKLSSQSTIRNEAPTFSEPHPHSCMASRAEPWNQCPPTTCADNMITLAKAKYKILNIKTSSHEFNVKE